jgi:hypothetical protein
MAVIQDTYSDAPAKGFPGMVSNMEASNRISRTVEDAAGIGFGKAAFRGTGDRGCTGVASDAAGFIGFTIADHGQPLLPGGTADTVPQYESVPIMTTGAIYVVAGTGGVVDGAAVTIGKGAGLADGISSIAADATHIAATGWEFDETAAAGAIVRIVRR